MKLSDMKKLKVAELRSRLQELGLDNKGLKAELLGRLWSALEAKQHDDKEEVKVQNDTCSPTPSAPVETADLRAPSPATEAAVTERCKQDFTREFTDTSTQTETDSLPSLQHGSEGILTLQHGSEGISKITPVYQAEEREVEMQQGGAEDPGEDRRALSSEEEVMGRGRAFYEFKEEIRYKR